MKPEDLILIAAANSLLSLIDNRTATDLEDAAWNAIVNLLEARLDDASAYVIYPE